MSIIDNLTGSGRISRRLLVATAALLAPSAAGATCIVSIEPSQNELVVRHNPLEQDSAQGTIEVNIVNRGDSDCEGTLGATLRGEPYGLRSGVAADMIPYQLVDEKGRKDITPRAGRNLQRPGGRVVRLAPGERSLELVSMTALPGNGVSEGRYVQSLDLEMLSGDGMLLGTKPLTLGVDIVPAALIGLKGAVARARGANSVDLGELEPGEKDLPVTLYVVSTGGYRVSVTSENQGRLKHQGAQWYIDYRLRLGRHALDLRSSDGFEVVSNHARLDNYPVRIEIGETEGKRAGDYIDRVTFTVAAL